MKEKLIEKLKKYPCHYTWDYDQKKFEYRLDRNINTCTIHSKESPDPTVYNLLGFMLAKKGRYAQAEEFFNKALKLASDEPITVANLAYFCVERGRHEEAISYIEQLALMGDPILTAWVYWEKAYLAVRLYEYEKAIELYRQAQLHWNTLPEQYAYRIFLYQAIILNRQVSQLKPPQLPSNKDIVKYRTDSIIDVLNKALKLNPDNYLIYCHLGVAFSHIAMNSKENFLQAANYFRESLTRKREDPNTLRFFGKLLLHKSHHKQALRMFNTSIQQKETSAAYHNRGMLYLRMRKLVEAQHDLEHAINLEPHNIAAMFDLVRVYQQQKQYKSALNWCQTIKDDLPDSCVHGMLYIHWAEALDANDNKEEAIAKYEEALKDDQLEKKLREKAQNNIVFYSELIWQKSKAISDLLAHFKILKKYKSQLDALNFLQGQKDNYSESFDIFYHIGTLLIESGKTSEGTENLIQAYHLVRNSDQRALCFRELHDIYLELARKLENAIPVNENIANQELSSFYHQVGTTWKICADLEKNMHRQDKLNWSRTLAVSYKSKTRHKVINIPGDELHCNLRQNIKEKLLTHSKTANRIKRSLNYASAQLSFVVSDRLHQSQGQHGRKFISIPLSIIEDGNAKHVTDYYKFYQFFISNNQHVPRSTGLLRDVLTTSPLSTYNDIIKSYLNKEPSLGFHRDYHCSERAFYGFLSNHIDSILDELEIKSGNQKGLKIYALIIDVHTDRYLCSRCETSTYYAYSPYGKFISCLVDAIRAREHCVQTKSGTLDVTVRVSAKKPASGQSKQSIDRHSDEIFELKGTATRQGILLLQRDDNACGIDDSSQLVFINQKKFST